MNTMQLFKRLGPLDTVAIRRDSLLRWMMVLPVGIALMARLLLPGVVMQLETLLQIELHTYASLLISYALLVITPVMLGMIIGFLLLDQRDDRTLIALQVTPLSLNSYLVYRLAVPMVAGFVMTLVAFFVAGLVDKTMLPLVVAALAATPLAPIVALALPVFAENKVQGFALMKASSILQIAPVIAIITQSNWQYLFGILPTYWPAKLYLSLQSGDPLSLLYLVLALINQTLLLFLLLRRFHTVIHR